MPDPRVSPVTEALRQMIVLLVDYPAALTIVAAHSDGCTTYSVIPDPRDTGKLIGKQGRTARALRTILGAIGAAEGWRYALSIEGATPSDSI